MQQSQKSQSSRQQKQQGLGNQKQIILGKDELDKMNLSEIYLMRSMKLTYLNYLDYTQQTISVTTLMSKYHFRKILGKRGFAYVKVPRHMSDELLKSNGLGFKGKMLLIEKVKTPPKAKSINGVYQNICRRRLHN